MRRSVLLWTILAITVFGGVSVVDAQSSRRANPSRVGKPRVDDWAVFGIGNDIVAERQSQFKDLRLHTDACYKQQLAEYKQQTKAGEHDGAKPDTPTRPTRPTVTLLKGHFKTKEDATRWGNKFISEHEGKHWVRDQAEEVGKRFLGWKTLEVGDIGRLCNRFKVIQVIDDHNAIVETIFGNAGKKVVWLNVPTKGMVDDEIYSDDAYFEIVSTRTYETAAGSKTVFVLKPSAPP
jgi:hypothetical protein